MLDSLVREQRMDMLFRISIFLLCLIFVESLDCTRQNFVKGNKFDKGFDTSNLLASYAHGEEVRVQCKLGHYGYFKLICNDGIWDSKGEICQARSCGHPGEAEFADFQLVEGRDFVFSSKVVYTCHKGYQMTSRRNFRRCMDGGWDGGVPICEPTYCPVITVDRSLRVDGNMEEATYGSVIQFKCYSYGQALYGTSELYCEENGEWKGVGWTGQPPTCDVITCTPPVIENGNVEGNVQEYHKDQVLRYKCNHGFAPLSKPSQCVLQGVRADWSIKPLCEVVRCKLTPYSGTSHDSDKNVFLPGEEVMITCEEKHWIGNNQGTSARSVCQQNGEWTITPKCNEVICSNPHDQLVSNYRRFQDDKKMDETVTYDCVPNFKKPAGVHHAKCTREGWIPKPLCIGRGDCSDPEVEKGFFQRPNKGLVYYTCDEGYKLFSKGWWASAECKDGSWFPKPQNCIEETKCGELPVIPHGQATTQNTNNQAQKLMITCNKGYSSEIQLISCVNGEWNVNQESLPTICKPVAALCDPPPRVNNAVIKTSYQKTFLTFSAVTYQCREHYAPEKDDTIICNNGEWENKTIRCIFTGDDVESSLNVTKLPPRGNDTCDNPPALADGELVAGIKKDYSLNDRVTYGCQSYYTMEGGPDKICINGEWNGEMRCIKPCIVNKEDMDRQNVKFGFSNEEKIYSRHGDKITFKCKSEKTHRGSIAMRQTCVEGEMQIPTCT